MKNISDFINSSKVYEDANNVLSKFASCVDTDQSVFVSKSHFKTTKDIEKTLQKLGYSPAMVYCNNIEGDSFEISPAVLRVMNDASNEKFAMCLYDLDKADTKIQNSLMPIIDHNYKGVKLDNVYVFAVGEDINKLPKPLQSRLSPQI